MRRTIEVHVGEAPALIGRIRHDLDGARESAAFEYDPAWLSRRDAFPIDPGLPLVAGPQFAPKARGGSPFPRVIADTEPDGWGRRVILRDHAKRRQAARRAGGRPVGAALCALDFLLSVDDASRVGALRFAEGGVFLRAREPGKRSTPPIVELGMLLAATRAVETHTETEADLAYLLGRGTSLGGLRPKCSVIDEDGHLAIGKFPSVADERAVTKGEVLAMRLARRAGLTVAAARLLDCDGAPVAIIRRFDRTPGGERILYASASTLLGVDAEAPDERAYTEIVDAIRVHGADARADIEELWRRVAFSIAITNVDDHLRNHGFLHVERGRWRLAPAFDLNPFPDRVRELKTWISEDTGPEASMDALMSVTAYFRLSLARAREIRAEVEHAVARWREEGRTLGMSPAELDAFSDAFEHTERGT